MTNRITSGVEALESVPVPVTWDMVESRARASGALDGARALDDRSGLTAHRRLILASVGVAAVVVALLVGVLATRGNNSSPLDTGPGVSTPTTTGDDGPATTQPAVGTAWGSAVTAWTGTDYLVWSGQVGDDSRQRADGWRYNPATGITTTIPVAPIAPRDNAAGVWTGTELVVCCGRAANGEGSQYDTASAAAFNPTTNQWRQLASPPAVARGYTIGAAWTGTEMLVLIQTGDLPQDTVGANGRALYAYDPATYGWQVRATPPIGDRFSSVTWAGDQLVIWTSDSRGATFDPATNSWHDLPGPAVGDPIDHGTIAWVNDELVVWGLDRTDPARTVGYRLYFPTGCPSGCRSGTNDWQPMAPAPIPSIEPYDGTPGSQTVAIDHGHGRLIILPVTGGHVAGGVPPQPPSLLSYDPAADMWLDLHTQPIGGYAPDLTIGGTAILHPDHAQPSVAQLPG